MGNCAVKDGPGQLVEKEMEAETQGGYQTYEETAVNLDGMPPRERARQVLAEGTLRLLSAAWLLSQPVDYIIQRNQELPPEAFVEPATAAELFGKMFGIVALSYGWLSQWHPDPEGFHTNCVCRYLEKHLKRFNRLNDVGVFWDFVALPQCDLDGADRTAEEEWLWKRGLRGLSAIYGGTHTVVLQLTLLPEDEAELTEDEAFYRSAYLLRGWCFFECTVATLVKDADQLLDLGAAITELEDEGTDWDQVQERARGSRLPPLAPEDMATALADRQFTNSDDMYYLSETYSEFFNEAAGSATWLWFENNNAETDGWGDEELELFVRALPAFSKCQAIRLWGHRMLSEQGLAMLREQLPHQTALGRLLLPKHLEATPEGKAMKASWVEAGKTPNTLMWC